MRPSSRFCSIPASKFNLPYCEAFCRRLIAIAPSTCDNVKGLCWFKALSSKQFRIKLWHVPAFCVLAIALFYTIRLQNLFDSYSRLLNSRKPRDTEIIAKSLTLIEEAGGRGKLEGSVTQLIEGSHRNTAVMVFKEGRKYPDLIVQPKNHIEQDAFRLAIAQWNEEPFGGDLYKQGVTFCHPKKLPFCLGGDTYHLIATRQSLNEGSYELMLVTNIDRSVGAEYLASTIALTILLAAMAGAIVPGLLSLTVSVRRVTKSVRYEGISPSWYWAKEVVALFEAIKDYKASTALYKVQIDQSTSGQMIVRSMGIQEAIIYSPNKAIASISGYTQAELEGQPLNLIVPEEFHKYHFGLGVYHSERKRRVGMAAYAEGCPFHGAMASEIVGRDRTVDLKCKNGSIRKVVLGVYYVGRNDLGEDEWAGVVTDVSELVQAVAKATEAKEENLRLTQAWSHDLKGHAKGVWDELSDLRRLGVELKTEAERVCFDSAIARAELTYNLIQNTRDLGDLELKLRDVLTHEIRDRIKLTHGARNLVFKWPDQEYFVRIDMDRFISMGMNNLIENAFKYSLGTNPEVIVGLKVDGEFAKFFVQDFGLGMDEAGQAKVMSGNFGSRVRLNPQIPGTGQGIFSARRVFKAHDAELNLKSQLGQGSVFVVKLRLGQKSE